MIDATTRAREIVESLRHPEHGHDGYIVQGEAELIEAIAGLLHASERPKCAYCSFGEDADFTLDDLKRHAIAECDFHPMRKMLTALRQALESLDEAQVAAMQGRALSEAALIAATEAGNAARAILRELPR